MSETTAYRIEPFVIQPVAEIKVVGGEVPYLWIGCQGTVTNRRALRAIASRINRVLAVSAKPKRKPPRKP